MKRATIIIFTGLFLIFSTSLVLSKPNALPAVYLLLLDFGPDEEMPKRSKLLTVYLPAIIAISAPEEEEPEEDDPLVSTGNFLKDFKLAINGLPPSRHSLEEVSRRYREMKYDSVVCMQVSYYHLNGGPFDKVVINNKLYDVMVIEHPPKRWNHGPFLIDDTGQCKNWSSL